MNPLFDAAREIFQVLEALKVRACLIGGLAVQRWGAPRQTLDVDVTMAVELERDELLVDALLARFKPRMADARTFALTRRVLLLEAGNGVGLDLALGLTDFEAETVDRATPYEFAPSFSFPTCSAEDLLIHKCFAGRPRDLDDAASVIARNRDRLDVAAIRHWLNQLAQALDDPEVLQRFERLWRLVGP
jgi:hypothetical protein